MQSAIDLLEDQLLKYSNVELQLFKRYFIEIFGGEQIYILECGNIEYPPLILLHGYGSTSSFFYKLFKILIQKFRVICMDLRGFARSSKPRFTCKTCNDTEYFFVSVLESIIDNQRIDMKGHQKFYLSGHSLGGYVCMAYALKHPEQIQELILLSPLGFRAQQNQEQLEKRLKEMPFVKRLVFRFMRYLMIEKDLSPLTLLRKMPFRKKMIQKFYTRRRFNFLPVQEISIMEDLILNIYSQTGSGDKCLTRLLDGFWPREPFPFRISEDFDLPMKFIFGDVENDYMYDEIMHDLVKYGNRQLILINNAGHQLVFQKPEETANAMVDNSLDQI